MEQAPFEWIEDLQIQFLSGEPDIHILKGEIVYGLNQSMRDDTGPVSLEFSFNNSIEIHKTDGRYVLFPVMKDAKYLKRFFEKTYFKEIKEESYSLQVNYYQHTIEHKEEFECCPEYIEQAKKFLSRSKKEFKSLSDLFLEVYCKKVTLKLTDNQYLIYRNGNLW